MKVDLTQPILGLDGEPLTTLFQEPVNQSMSETIRVYEELHGKGSASDFITAYNKRVKDKDFPSSIGMVCRQSLMKGTEEASEDKKLKFFEIGLKCSSDTADLDDSERELIKGLVHKNKYPAIVYGRISQAFDSDKAKKKD